MIKNIISKTKHKEADEVIIKVNELLELEEEFPIYDKYYTRKIK